MSRERCYAAEAEAVDIAEGNMCGPVMRGSIAQPWVEDAITHKGNKSDLGISRVWPGSANRAVRMGKVMIRSR